MKPKRSKVFIVDDYPPMRQSLRKLLEMEDDFEVCGEADNVKAAVQGILASQPDAAIIDLILGQETGVQVLKGLEGHLDKIKILILSLMPESWNADTMLSHGARGYIMKSESPDQILQALRQICKGQVYVSPALRSKLKNQGENSHE